jgi:hypothetical protein
MWVGQGTYLEFALQLFFFSKARNLGVAACRSIPRAGGGEISLIFGVGFEQLRVRGAKDVVGVELLEEVLVVIPREKDVTLSM